MSSALIAAPFSPSISWPIRPTSTVLAYSYVKDRDAALDVVQESIVKPSAGRLFCGSPPMSKPGSTALWSMRASPGSARGSGWSRWRISWNRKPHPNAIPARLDLYDAMKSSAKRSGRSSACAF